MAGDGGGMSEFVCDVMLEDLLRAAHHQRVLPSLRRIPKIDGPAIGLRIVLYDAMTARSRDLELLADVVRQLVFASVIDGTTVCNRFEVSVRPDLVAFGMVRIIVLPAGGSVVEP